MSEQEITTAKEPLLRVVNVHKNYPDGEVQALCEVNLEIHRGEYVAIMGPSGSGKSTLLSIIGALDLPTSGEVLFDGESLTKCRDLDNFRSRRIGFVFQSFHLLPTLSALENVQMPMFEGRLKRDERQDLAADLLQLIGMGHRLNHLPPKLSVGERQRVAIARALANDPDVLLADEPTGNLDSKTERETLDLFDRLHHEHNLTIITVTHSDVVAARAERIVRLFDGRIVEDRRVAV